MIMQAEEFHKPVLRVEVIDALQVIKDHWYVDATAGGGGHTHEIIKLGGRVLAIDQDADAIAVLHDTFKAELGLRRIIIVQGNFRQLTQLTRAAQLTHIDGILFDLGLSTYQIKQSGRGFSFLRDEPLDMRMDARNNLTAAEIVNHKSFSELAQLFTRFGEEHLGREIAESIVEKRKTMKITTTAQLQNIVVAVYKKAHMVERIHPATRVFQALRIAVNEELASLHEALPQAIDLLTPGARCCVISFHSLEDRIVKQAFIQFKAQGLGSILTKKPWIAAYAEVYENSAARSAKLRVFEKN